MVALQMGAPFVPYLLGIQIDAKLSEHAVQLSHLNRL
jgi:hypothetical protein